MTASATARDRQTRLGAGMDDFVSKPLRKKQLKAALIRRLPQRVEPAPEPADDLFP